MDIVSNRAHYLFMKGELDLDTDTLKVALMTSGYTPDKDTNTFVNTFEITGTGYTAGGATMTGNVVTQEDASDVAKWDAADVEWAASTITARYAVIYNTTRSDAIVGIFDFITDKLSSDGLFALRWNAAGVMTMGQA